MKYALMCSIRPASMAVWLLLACGPGQIAGWANPTGGTVTQGTATFSTSGSQLTIQTSSQAYINWQTFNIGVGETTTFVQPSSSSVVWNQINGANPSQILGNLNANGYVVLQNQSGFYIGGQASITAHGLMMTTAPIPMPDLSSGGAWQFNTPPPTAQIINYGQINVVGGGSAFLIANDIENNGTISAPGGQIGLYAGEQVLVSSSPDGHGLSTQVTLPQGSVDNNGKLIADAGSIALQAQTVNQNGLIQADSVQNVNGVIELVASSAVNLGANSVISAQGDSTGNSSGGTVTINSDNNFSDQAGSTITTAGGAQGGNGGNIEISAPNLESLNSTLNASAQNGFTGGEFLLDPAANIVLGTSTANGMINVNSFTGSSITVETSGNITLNTGTTWNLSVSTGETSGQLTLEAGGDITFENNSQIIDANSWSITLAAGYNSGNNSITAGTGTIYLNNGNISNLSANGNGTIQSTAGSINLSAGESILVGSGAVTTLGGGSINATAMSGNVNTGDNYNGYLFAPSKSLNRNQPPYYNVNPSLGGISTAAGGNVTITAGGNVTSYLPNQTDYNNNVSRSDAGAGAFGTEPGNVTITAGGNVSGNYVVANGVGSVTAGGNIGVPVAATDQALGFALSLINGSWSVYAPNGSIYLDDVINPNGVFNDNTRADYTGYHYFDYGALDSVLLDAGDSVQITGAYVPLAVASDDYNNAPSDTVPILLPPTLQVIAGSGGFVLDTSVILFPSPDQNLDITTLNGGNFEGPANSVNPVSLEMSDSSLSQWSPGTGDFGPTDQATTPPELNNLNPVEISVSGSLENMNLYTTKETQITVAGDMINCGFSGQNLHASDATSIMVTGSIINSPLYSFVSLSSGIASANPLQSGAWDSVFVLAVNPSMLAQLANLNINNQATANAIAAAGGLDAYLQANNYLLFPSGSTGELGANPGFVYDPTSLQLGFKGNMSSILSASQIADLENGSFTVLVVNSAGAPFVNTSGQLQTQAYNFNAAAAIAGANGLEAESLTVSPNAITQPQMGYQIGGPGQFNISAASIDLGNSSGILSFGFGDAISFEGVNYAALEGVSGMVASGGAAINVNVNGNLSMATSAIGSLDGGNVTVNAGGEIDLSEGDFVFETSECYGIYTSGHSDVSVTAYGNINIGSARIAAFNGGNVLVDSLNGDVNAGIGANVALSVYGFYINPSTGLPTYTEFGDLTDATTLQANPTPYGSGIMALLPTSEYLTPGGIPLSGNITVETPNGNINSTFGGISQFALGGTAGAGPVINLIAGTAGIPFSASQGNIDLGNGGVIGGAVNITATGKVTGQVLSRQNTSIVGQSFVGTVFSQGTADIAAVGPVTRLIVGIGGIGVSGQGITATMLSQNISDNGASAASTLGTSATATSSSQSAAQQSVTTTKQQLASDDTENNGDDDKKKKKGPVLQHIKRVTVILPKAT